MISPQQLIEQLIKSQDNQERLVGADWLMENGYVEDANFFIYVINHDLEPHHYLECWRWYNNTYHTGFLASNVEKSIIDSSIYNLLPKALEIWSITRFVHIYNSRFLALEALLDAYHTLVR